MKARIVDFLVITPERQRLTIDVQGDFRDVYEKVKESDVDVQIKKFHGKRSLTANAYLWVLLDKLATATGIEVRNLYFDYLKNVGGNMEMYCGKPEAIDRLEALWKEQGNTGWGWPYVRFPSKLDGCENIRLYYGSSQMDSATFSRLVDHVVQDCQQVGIETMTEEELKSLLGGRNEKSETNDNERPVRH